MSIEIKDYLHLYLGCEVAVIDKMAAEYNCEEIIYTDKLKGVTESEVKPGEMIAIIGDVFQEEYIDRIKPILRPLSDMSDDECWYSQNAFGHFVKGTSEPYIQNRLHCIKDSYTDFRNILPHQFAWLLKQGFDLFGLIESGLAIDKTKIKDHD